MGWGRGGSCEREDGVPGWVGWGWLWCVLLDVVFNKEVERLARGESMVEGGGKGVLAEVVGGYL